jgi:uncharacterized protein
LIRGTFVTTDDLTTPLGGDTKPAPVWRRYRLPFSASQVVAALLALVLLTFLGFAVFNDDPFGGEPIARIALHPSQDSLSRVTPGPSPNPAAAPTAAASPVAALPATGQQSAPPDQKTVTIIDGSSGARHDVTVPTSDADRPQTARTAAAMSTINPQLLEQGHYGMIPIAAGELKPSLAYAAGTDALRAKAAAMPAVAIVIGNLGIGAARSTEAIMKLPGAVTLAFTPYGADPSKLVERARAQGHEVLLQIPLEPFDYPDNDPGPQTLLTTLSTDQNLDRLDWLMSRFQGYVGLTSFMGARFLPNEQSMQPLIHEAAKRGLVYFDDSTSTRSSDRFGDRPRACSARDDRPSARLRGRRRICASALDRSHLLLGKDPRRPRNPARSVDNGNGKIKIELNHDPGSGNRFPERDLQGWRATKICLTGPASG